MCSYLQTCPVSWLTISLVHRMCKWLDFTFCLCLLRSFLFQESWHSSYSDSKNCEVHDAPVDYTLETTKRVTLYEGFIYISKIYCFEKDIDAAVLHRFLYLLLSHLLLPPGSPLAADQSYTSNLVQIKNWKSITSARVLSTVKTFNQLYIFTVLVMFGKLLQSALLLLPDLLQTLWYITIPKSLIADNESAS